MDLKSFYEECKAAWAEEAQYVEEHDSLYHHSAWNFEDLPPDFDIQKFKADFEAYGAAQGDAVEFILDGEYDVPKPGFDWTAAYDPPARVAMQAALEAMDFETPEVNPLFELLGVSENMATISHDVRGEDDVAKEFERLYYLTFKEKNRVAYWQLVELIEAHPDGDLEITTNGLKVWPKN